MCLCEAEKKDSKNMAAAKELATDDVKNNQDPKFWKVGFAWRSIKAPHSLAMMVYSRLVSKFQKSHFVRT